MILEQYYIECLSHASYLIADEDSKRAVVVDPRRDITDYLADAQRYGLTIEGVINTHFHADFLAGHLELRERVGAPAYLAGLLRGNRDPGESGCSTGAWRCRRGLRRSKPARD